MMCKILLLLLLCAGTALAQALPSSATAAKSAPDQFKEAYDVLTKADIARDRTDYPLAVKLYDQAMIRYIDLSQKYPSLDAEVVKFRISYCKTQLEALAPTQQGGVPDAQPVQTRPKAQPTAAPTLSADSKLSNSSSSTNIAVAPGLAQARQYLKENQPDKAMDLLLPLFRQNPGNLEAQILIATAQCRVGRYEDAISMANGITEEHPESSAAYLLLGTAHFGLGQMKDAATATQKAIDLNPKSAEAYFDMTQIILATPPLNTDSARAHYKKAIELGGAKDPNLEFLLK